jgi:hypothetical protein
MLYHLRRLQRDPVAFQQCVNKTSGTAMTKVKELMDMLEAPGAASADALESQSVDESQVAPTIHYPDDVSPEFPTSLTAKAPAPSAKRLRREVTLDEEGYPKMLGARSPKPQSPVKGEAPAASVSLVEQLYPQAKAKAMPKSKALPKSKATAKSTAQPKASAKAQPQTQDGATSKDWQYMYYKNNNSIGIRRKFGSKNQVFSFVGKGLEHAQLIKLAKLCLVKLLSGEAEEAVAIWVKADIANKTS